MKKQKPKFTEKEIEELNDLHELFGREVGIYEVISFVKKELNLSETHKLSCDLRIKFNKEINERKDEFNKLYEKSTLNNKLMKRLSNEKN